MLSSSHLSQLPNSPEAEPVKRSRCPSMWECLARQRWFSTIANGKQMPRVQTVIGAPSSAVPTSVAAPPSQRKRTELRATAGMYSVSGSSTH
jgi:hypothetical protein